MTNPVQQTDSPHRPKAFRAVPRTGVIYVNHESSERGFTTGDPEWANLGRGQPECGPLPGAPPRIDGLPIEACDHEYAPIGGIRELREAVAELYNRLYRQGMSSQYGPENVVISGGGRAALARAAAALGAGHLGHFLPDYTAYEELLDLFRAVTPIPIPLDAEAGYAFDEGDLEREIRARGLTALLLSNPCNPTGRLVSGGELADWLGVARGLGCALLFDEFYSHYIWRPAADEPGPTVSAARYVEDVDRDPVVIFDGLTKNWRYSGWRIAWTLGPRPVIEAMESAGSFMDGGASRPMQRAAVSVLEPEEVLRHAAAIRAAFLPKRQRVLSWVAETGLSVDREPDGTFYAFVSLDGLPEPLDDGLAFFQHGLDYKVITVPGTFFDVNPGGKRPDQGSRLKSRTRLSYGPPLDEVERGLAALEEMIEGAREGRKGFTGWLRRATGAAVL